MCAECAGSIDRPRGEILRVLAVAQAFKETLSLADVAGALEGGIRDAGAGPDVLLGSDGGDGLLDALGTAIRRRSAHVVTGPLGEPRSVEVGWLDEVTAVIESRLACGLSLVPPERRDPGRTTSRGVGELIQQAAVAGAEEILVGLGGSATMDGGLGMAQPWGWLFLDERGHAIAGSGAGLEQIAAIRPGRPPGGRIVGLVDVRNPLLGENGARVYASQKGASPRAEEQLSRGLSRLAALVPGGAAHAACEGAGAAGGLGFGLMAFAGASLRRGAEWVLERARFGEVLRTVQLVICAEGTFDGTSVNGKLTGEVIHQATSAGVRAGVLAPRVQGVPPGVLVESGGGQWTADDLRRNTARLVHRALRTAVDA